MFSNKYVKNLKPYPLSSHKAWELQDTEEILKLDWNEATLDPSPKVKESIMAFLETGKMHWYPDVRNDLLLNELSIYCDLPIDNIQYFASSDSLQEYIARTFIDPDDKVVLVAPTYDNFRATVESCGATVDFYYLNEQFQLENDHFYSYLSSHKPKVVYICNPNNPTGTIYSQATIERIIRTFPQILFIIDEAYYEFTRNSSQKLVLENENIFITRTFSKAFALASFRVGYALSSSENIELISKIRNPKNISTLSQLAAIAVLQDKEHMERYVDSINDSKLFFSNELKSIGYSCSGEGGNFVLIKVDFLLKRRFIKFLETKGIFVRDYGHVKAMENFLRITIGTKGQMQRVLNEIKNFT